MKKKKTPQESPSSIRIPDDIKEKAIKQAEKEDRSLSYIVVKALKKYLNIK